MSSETPPSGSSAAVAYGEPVGSPAVERPRGRGLLIRIATDRELVLIVLIVKLIALMTILEPASRPMRRVVRAISARRTPGRMCLKRSAAPWLGRADGTDRVPSPPIFIGADGYSIQVESCRGRVAALGAAWYG